MRQGRQYIAVCAIDDRASYNASDWIASHCSIPGHLMLSKGPSVFGSDLARILPLHSRVLSARQMP